MHLRSHPLFPVVKTFILENSQLHSRKSLKNPNQALSVKLAYCQGLSYSLPLEKKRVGKIETGGTRLEIVCPSSSQQLGSKAPNEEHCVTSVAKETLAAHTISRLKENNVQLVGACTIQRKLGYSVFYTRPYKGTRNHYRPAIR